MTDFNFVGKSSGEDQLLANDEENTMSKKGKLRDALVPATQRYHRVLALLDKGRSVMAGLKATNDPTYSHTYNTMSLFLNNLEEALK